MKIPYDKETGVEICTRYKNLEDYDYELIDSKFSGPLKILDCLYKGRSAANFFLTDSKNRRFVMLAKDFAHMASNATIIDGIVEGNWEIKNRSGYYRIFWSKN